MLIKEKLIFERPKFKQFLDRRTNFNLDQFINLIMMVVCLNICFFKNCLNRSC